MDVDPQTTKTGMNTGFPVVSLDDHPDVWIIGYGRSGTNWLARMVADVLGIYNWKTDALTEPSRILKLHFSLERPKHGPILFIYRDPRDVLVSMREIWRWKTFDELFDHDPGPAPLPLEGIDRFFQRWIGEIAPRVQIKFRNLIDRPLSTLGDALKDASIPYDPARLPGAVFRHQFSNERARFMASGRTETVRLMGHGQVGRWKKELTKDAAYKIHRRLWRWLVTLGFETDPEWWRNLP